MTRSETAHTVAVLLSLSFAAPALHAQEVASEEIPAVTATLPNWSLGAGVIFYAPPSASVALAGLGGVYYVQAGAPAPAFSLSAERRLAQSSWLLLRASGSYSDTQEPISSLYVSSNGDVAHRTLTQAGIAAGLRHVFLSDIVDVSAYAMVGGAYLKLGGETKTVASQNLDGTATTRTVHAPIARGFTVGATAGLAVERSLIDRLSLRLATSLIAADWGKAAAVNDGANDRRVKTEVKGFHVGFQLSPSLEVRLYF